MKHMFSMCQMFILCWLRCTDLHRYYAMREKYPKMWGVGPLKTPYIVPPAGIEPTTY
jgi:hypothetical protein